MSKEVCRWCTHRNPDGSCKKIEESMTLESNLDELVEQGNLREYIEEAFNFKSEEVEELTDKIYEYFQDNLKVNCVTDVHGEFKCKYYQ